MDDMICDYNLDDVCFISKYTKISDEKTYHGSDFVRVILDYDDGKVITAEHPLQKAYLDVLCMLWLEGTPKKRKKLLDKAYEII